MKDKTVYDVGLIIMMVLLLILVFIIGSVIHTALAAVNLG